MMAIEEWSEPDEIFATDACLVGCGAYFKRNYFHCTFPEFVREKDLHINCLELLALMVSLKVFRKDLKGKRIVINCDNQATVNVVNKGSSRDLFMQECLREITYICAIGEFEVRCKYLAGVDNRLPDILSRWSFGPSHAKQFYALTKNVRLTPIFVPNDYFHFLHDW